MAKADLWKEDLITIIIVLFLVFIDDIKKEWSEFHDNRTKNRSRSETHSRVGAADQILETE